MKIQISFVKNAFIPVLIVSVLPNVRPVLILNIDMAPMETVNVGMVSKNTKILENVLKYVFQAPMYIMINVSLVIHNVRPAKVLVHNVYNVPKVIIE